MRGKVYRKAPDVHPGLRIANSLSVQTKTRRTRPSNQPGPSQFDSAGLFSTSPAPALAGFRQTKQQTSTSLVYRFVDVSVPVVPPLVPPPVELLSIDASTLYIAMNTWCATARYASFTSFVHWPFMLSTI